MKKYLIFICLFAFGLMLISSSPEKEYSSEKITICHIPPGNPSNAHTIRINVNALPAHLAHGDLIGECNTNECLPPECPCPDGSCSPECCF